MGQRTVTGIFLKVTTYSGHKGDERPTTLSLGGRVIKVEEIVDRWYGSDHAYFKLTADDGSLYVIRHDQKEDTWEMVMMEAGPRAQR